MRAVFLATGLAVTGGLAAACAQQAPSRPSDVAVTTRTAIAAPSPSASIESTPSASAWPLVLPVPAAKAGLHQTGRRPTANSLVFHAEMTDLWAAVVTGRPKPALPAFFPLVAYEQVKAIADPAADWQNRLVAEFDLDVRAAHRLLGRQARHAVLLRVIVPESQASWIDPGVCYNGVGYWHVAGARLVYRVAGQERSIGIASLISWRGRWYVVHFGAVLRTSSGGVVDQPAQGPGAAGPPGGC
jgi:predicted outer membrane protein